MRNLEKLIEDQKKYETQKQFQQNAYLQDQKEREYKGKFEDFERGMKRRADQFQSYISEDQKR